ncbi:calcium/sodium antiporter [Aquibacillus koreensis]|uniref:Calcium/sodium antiporter n=1 Tax=Aquibacillus koreensis TaxID=279446 RepID=A0A9X3WP01_9BACI|nr:calcium/sodium antiporter [Aquibacillus koreensis]MCT2536163.1 calcium/sodium antiporter [Aquibacillus koreensis]MDC3422088.1 calcium/sodium antiporter [Aquibacillus koreensis]
MDYLILIVGFVLLIKGADFFVDGSSKIAKALHVSPLLIGLTIVSFGTSAPEATVSILAAVEGNASVSLGNVVGSNIFNITLAIGLTAVIFPLKVESATIRKEIPFTLLTSVALYILIIDVTLQGTATNILTRSDGIILLLFLLIFMSYIFEVARSNREHVLDKTVTTSTKEWGKNIFITLIGLGAIIFGGNLVVNSSTEIAYAWCMSETLVGLTIVAIGTSLPELVTSVMAAFKKQSDIALGNVVGSSIFNILFVLGTTATITPLAIESKIFFDIIIMITLTIALLVFSSTKRTISRGEGAILATAYIIYLVYIIIRN